MQELITRAKELLADGTVSRVLGWKKGDMGWDPEPAYFEKEEDLKDFVYNPFCGANLSKYLIAAGKLEGTTLVFLKPCDTYSFNQLTKEHRVKREKTYIIGVGCHGTLKAEKVLSAGIKGIEEVIKTIQFCLDFVVERLVILILDMIRSMQPTAICVIRLRNLLAASQ